MGKPVEKICRFDFCRNCTTIKELIHKMNELVVNIILKDYSTSLMTLNPKWSLPSAKKGCVVPNRPSSITNTISG